MDSQKDLSFGGESYQIDTGDRIVVVDWIVRDDEYQEFYEQALRDAIATENGIRLITPEWLVILKYNSAKAKDKLDLIWLLQADNLVNRDLLKTRLRDILGDKAALFVIREFESEFAYADFLKLREQKKYE